MVERCMERWVDGNTNVHSNCTWNILHPPEGQRNLIGEVTIKVRGGKRKRAGPSSIWLTYSSCIFLGAVLRDASQAAYRGEVQIARRPVVNTLQLGGGSVENGTRGCQRSETSRSRSSPELDLAGQDSRDVGIPEFHISNEWPLWPSLGISSSADEVLNMDESTR